MNTTATIPSLLFASLIVVSIADLSQAANSDSSRAKGMSRAEDRGEDLSSIPVGDAVSTLYNSKDHIERRKLAKAIGDRSKEGQLMLSQQQEKVIAQVVSNTLQEAKSTNANDRAEARQQIERLWHVAVPTLIANITTNDLTVSELAIKSLILMRDERIVRALIQEARTANDDGKRELIAFALSKMKEQRESLIPGRECLGEKESKELYDRLVTPALAELGQTLPDPSGKSSARTPPNR